MPRIALVNMIAGFFLLTFAGASGAFLATDITYGYISDPALLASWRHLLQRSAHGHTNLFGMIHILFGLTLMYSRLTDFQKALQTIGLGLASASMCIGMFIKSYAPATIGVGVFDIVIGAGLSAGLLALASHGVGLALRVRAS
jgi:hypothetical protein